MQLLTLIADVYFVFSRFQLRLQRDSTTVVDLPEAVDNVKAKITQLNENHVLGGWQEAFDKVSREEH